MSEELFPYYERELLFVRQLTQEFARRYPGAAGRLLLEPNRSADPHVERLIEAFALLAGRVHHKLDDEFPELTDALLQVLYPHYLAPIPSLAIVQFELDAARGQFNEGSRIERQSRLTTAPLQGLPCRYRTTYPVTLWPIQLTNARFQTPPFSPGLPVPPRTAAALTLEFECQAQEKFSTLTLETLRLFLFGDNQVVPYLYEILFNHALSVVFRNPEGDVQIVMQPDKCLKQVGFEKDEGLLPYPERAFLGYRLLTEYFAFPAKFLFLDLSGWAGARKANFGRKCEVTIFFNRTLKSLEQGVDAGTFRLGCTPIVNLFEQVAEPINLAHTKFEYRIVPDVAHPQGMEVYTVEEVSTTDPTTNRVTEYQPFYSFRHGSTQDNLQTFWYASRRPSLEENDRGTDVYLHLVDLGFNPSLPGESTMVLRTVCSNRGLPLQLQLAGEALVFELEASAPLAGIRCLRPPTSPLRPRTRRGGYWRLLSHLNLNYLSLTDPVEGREAFQELLRLYDFSDPESGQQQMAAMIRQMIEGITSISSRRVLGRIPGEAGTGFCRGIEVTIEFDEEKYVGSGLFLFASVLERFLGLYVTINSFSQLVARSKQGDTVIKKWPPRSGAQQLL